MSTDSMLDLSSLTSQLGLTRISFMELSIVLILMGNIVKGSSVGEDKFGSGSMRRNKI